MTTAPSAKHTRLKIAAIIIAIIATALILATAFPNPPRQLKQNLYQKTFTDHPYDLVSLDVIILYETETDGTWRGRWRDPWGGLPAEVYNITVLISPNYINESMISNVNVLDWEIGAGNSFAKSGSYYHPAQAAPVDWGTNLMGFWSNRNAWCVVSQLCYPYLFDSTGRILEFTNIYYHFAIREIQTNGTRFIFGVDDIFSVPVSG